MFLEIDPASSIPIYEQLMEQVKRAVIAGDLKAGDKLPSVRDVATRLRLNPKTVAQTYRELEHQDVVYTRRGEGTFVQGMAPEAQRDERERLLQEAVDELIACARRLDVTDNEILTAIQMKLKQEPENKGGKA